MHPESRQWHLVDISPGRGMVVRLQHAHLSPEEADERTAFHKTSSAGLWWIVNAANREAEVREFVNRSRGFEWLKSHRLNKTKIDTGAQIVHVPRSVALFGTWIDAGAPVAFDFGEDRVWVLAGVRRDPLTGAEKGYGYYFSKENLVETIMTGTVPVNMGEILDIETEQCRPARGGTASPSRRRGPDLRTKRHR